MVQLEKAKLEKESQDQETQTAHHEVGSTGEYAETKILNRISQ